MDPKEEKRKAGVLTLEDLDAALDKKVLPFDDVNFRWDDEGVENPNAISALETREAYTKISDDEWRRYENVPLVAIEVDEPRIIKADESYDALQYDPTLENIRFFVCRSKFYGKSA